MSSDKITPMAKNSRASLVDFCPSPGNGYSNVKAARFAQFVKQRVEMNAIDAEIELDFSGEQCSNAEGSGSDSQERESNAKIKR
jgi:hypothetical protein